MAGTQKIVNLALLLAGFVLFLFLYQAISFGWEWGSLPVMNNWPLRPDALISFGVVLVSLFFVRRSETVNRFLNEVVVELGKVVWPERKETIMSTGVVAVMVGISALLLFLIDFIWGTVSRSILNF